MVYYHKLKEFFRFFSSSFPSPVKLRINSGGNPELLFMSGFSIRSRMTVVKFMAVRAVRAVMEFSRVLCVA